MIKLKISILFITAMIFQLLLPVFIIAPAEAQNAGGTRFGMNVWSPSYYGCAAEYIDYFYAGSAWGAAWPGPPKNVPTYGPDGYPISGSAFMLDEQAGFPSGAYQFYGEGNWDINLAFAANPNSAHQDRMNGHTYVGFVPGSLKINVVNGITVVTGLVQLNFSQAPFQGTFNGSVYGPALLLTVSNIDPNNTPHNLHCIRPDYPAWPATQSAPGYPFGKEYLQALGPFCGLRCDWDSLNNNITSWASRNNPNLPGTQCYCIERMIDLCNATNCDFWYNIPITADATYDTGFAQLVKARLKSNLKCRYEIGLKSCWNWAYPYSVDWQIIDTMANGNANTNPPTPASGTPAGMPPLIPSIQNGWARHAEVYAAMTMSHAANIQAILGSQGIPVFSGQFVNNVYVANALLYVKQAMGIDPAAYGIEIAGAPYVAVNNAAADTTTDLLFSDMQNYLNTALIPSMKQNMAVARQYNVPFDCYEAGQGAPNPTAGSFSTLQMAQTDPRMATLIYEPLSAMLINGGANMCNYYGFIEPDGSFGFWGAMNSILDYKANPNNPTIKYVVEAAAASSCNCPNRQSLPPPPSLPLPPSGPSSGGGNNGHSSNNSGGNNNNYNYNYNQYFSQLNSFRNSFSGYGYGNNNNSSFSPGGVPMMGSGGGGSSGGGSGGSNSSSSPGGIPWMQ